MPDEALAAQWKGGRRVRAPAAHTRVRFQPCESLASWVGPIRSTTLARLQEQARVELGMVGTAVEAGGLEEAAPTCRRALYLTLADRRALRRNEAGLPSNGAFKPTLAIER